MVLTSLAEHSFRVLMVGQERPTLGVVAKIEIFVPRRDVSRRTGVLRGCKYYLVNVSVCELYLPIPRPPTCSFRSL